MASKFLNSNGVDLSALQDGTFSIYAKSIKVNDLDPNMNVSADQNKFLNSTNAGSGDMTYVGDTPATNYILKADSADGLSVSKSNIRDYDDNVYIDRPLLCDVITGENPGGVMSIGSGMSSVFVPASNGLLANAFTKTGGTNQQYLMANGSTLTQSAQSGNSNFYLYNNTALQTIPASGSITYNNTNPLLATIVRLSNTTRDAIDIIVFFKQINQLNDLYIQDQASSLNFIKYNITGTPEMSATYIAIPVIQTTSGGSLSTLVMVSFFTNNLEIDERLSGVETKTQNQSALPNTTTFTGSLTANSFIKSGGGTAFLKADGNIDTNTYLTAATAPQTSLQGAYDIGNGTISGALSTKPFIVKNGTAEILNAGTSITLGASNTPISLIGNLTITNSDTVIPLKRPDVPALAITAWSSGFIPNPTTVGLQITTLKTIVVSAVGCKTGVLLAAGDVRNFTIYNALGTVVGGPYPVNKTVLDSTGVFVKHSITPLILTAGIYYFAMSLSIGDYDNGYTVTTAYTAFDSSVISAFMGCYGSAPNVFPNILSTNASFSLFWLDSFASVKVDSVILAGGSLDTFQAVPLSIGTATTTAINIGRTGATTTLSSLFAPSGVGNIDIMLRDTPFIGIQFSNGSAYTATLNSPLLNSPWTAFGSTSSTGSVFSLTNNYTRQLCCADWSFPTPANGQLCGFGSSATTGARVSTGFNFGISAVLGYADIGYSPGIQNFFGLYNLSTAPALSSTVSITSLLNCILFGSSTTDANICIYTADASTMVKQVDLGVSFPSNRTSGSVSTDWFKFTLYWDTSKFYYKAHNTTTNVIVSGSFSSAAIPATSIQLYPQCIRVMGAAQTSNSCKLKVQRFGVYY
jgi:hypothetical protein